jgi:predicted RNase H-like HicB family nuclease
MNYPILIYPAEEGGFVGEIISMPGCIAQGEDYMECIEELEKVSKLWIEEYLLSHNSIPNPQSAIDKLLNFNKFEYV